ncbi:MAG: ABC transporter permease [Oscillospiraceae bacterium]
MLFKLSVSNIRRSLRDHAIYFFTLIIGVSIFYVFNAVGSQAAYMQMSESSEEIIKLLTSMMSGISVFVAGVLGLLIVYASRFLMKRRSREFALYLTLGMSKGKISAILLLETVLIGVGSLGAGLAAGVGLSQLMSALVANLFEADMTAYKFSVSGEAIAKTILYFAVTYIVVMIFNSLMISRLKLIDLINSGKRSEKIRLKNPVLCVLIFIVGAAALGYAYYQVGWKYLMLDNKKLLICIALGAVSTFLIFWSVSGMLLRVIMSMKNLYYRSLNCFTFRQISSKVNTMVFSMTVICLMLFVTICTLASAFSIRNSMNANLKELCPADCEIELKYFLKDETDKNQTDAALLYSEYGYDISEHFKEYVHFNSLSDEDFTFADFFGDNLPEIEEEYPGLLFDTSPELVTLGDYNRLMELYGKEPLTMNDDEFILLCD